MGECTIVHVSGNYDLTVYESYESFKERLIQACHEGQHYMPATIGRMGNVIDAFINVHRIDYIERR